MYAALRYAKNDNKTDRKMFVGGINCSKQNAYAEMIAVQKHFGMKGKVVAYHGIQSFQTGEVTPEEAFEIGKETARRMWGDKYQVLVTVHLNTDNLHCHFVVNPCSFRDGQKFKNKIGDHLELRRVSDEICREHGLSVLKGSDFYSKEQKKEYWAHKSGHTTHRDMLKRDIEYCLRYSSDGREFGCQLSGLGYTIDWDRMSVKGKGWERAVRLANIGFTNDVIRQYISENANNMDFYALEWNTHLPYKPKYAPVTKLMDELDFIVDHSNDAATVAVSAVLYIILALFELAKTVKDFFIQSPELRYEIRNVKAFVSEYRFLQSEQLNSLKDISDFIESTKSQIYALEQERDNADNKRRRASPEDKQKYKDKRTEITEKIKPLRNKLKQAEEIYEKSPRLFDLVKEEKNYERKALERSRTK